MKIKPTRVNWFISRQIITDDHGHYGHTLWYAREMHSGESKPLRDSYEEALADIPKEHRR